MPHHLVLIDGTAQLYRAFYAIRSLTDPQGQSVSAVYGFAQTLLRMMENYHPSHAAVVFDTPEPTHRHEAFADYKAQREKPPEDLIAQIPLVKELIRAFDIPVVEKPGLEADDILGTLACQAGQAGAEVLILTSDKDLFQLVNDHIHILRPLRGGKGEYERLDSQGIEKVFGVAPERVVDVLALMGDVSDNLPGVPGVGEKTAVDLIQRFGSVAALYANIDQIQKPKLQENLKKYQSQVTQMQELATILTAAPLPLSWDQCAVAPAVPDTAFARMLAHGFKSLLTPRRGAPQVAPVQAAWTGGVSLAAGPRDVLAAAASTHWLAVEMLPDGLALAADPRQASLLPKDELASNRGWVEACQDPGIKKVSYDLKPVVVALLGLGAELRGDYEDLHLMAHLLDLPANRPADFIARILGGPPPLEQPAWVASADLMIAKTLPSRLKAIGAEALYREVELPLLPVLAKMEAVGVALDVPALHELARTLGVELDRLEKEIQDMAGREFNIRSTQQLAEILFDQLQLSPGKKTKTGRSTNVDVLENLAAVHPLPQRVLEYRQVQKLKSTYVDVLPGMLDPRDGRLHTTFHQVGAATGRLSSSDPNLQNIPIRTEKGRELRRMFIAGHPQACLLSADYSQIELRLLAHLSQDEQMVADFASGLDIHRAMASQIFQVPMDQVTQEMRRQAKTCNFGIAYGVTPYGLARQLRISPPLAKGYIDGFFLRYPRVREYLDGILVLARQQGYVTTFLGRRRPTPEVNSANRTIREAGERMAINTPLQGSAADIIKLAMVKIARELETGTWRSRMILQVHDELVFEGPEEEMPRWRDRVVDLMSTVYPLRVALGVDAAWGKTWMEAHA